MNRIIFIISLLYVPALVFGQVDLEEGLLLYYSFTGEVLDEGPNNLQPEIINATQFVEDYTGEMNSALEFVGENSYFQIPHSDLLNFDTSDPFSVSLWIRPDQTQSDDAGTVNDILSKWYTDENIKEELGYPFVLRYYNQTSSTNGAVVGAIFGGESSTCIDNDVVATNATANDGEWHHLLFTKDENMQLQIYLDCRLEASFNMQYLCSPQNSAPLRVGKRGPPNERNYTGGMDEFRIYNRKVTPDELGILCGMNTTQTEEVNAEVFKIYPNPSDGLVFLETAGVIRSLTIFDHLGKKVILPELMGQGSTLSLDVHHLPAGIYFLNAQLDERTITRKLIVVQSY